MNIFLINHDVMLSLSKHERKGLNRMFRQAQHDTVFRSPQGLPAGDPAHANALTPMKIPIREYSSKLYCRYFSF